MPGHAIGVAIAGLGLYRSWHAWTPLCRITNKRGDRIIVDPGPWGPKGLIETMGKEVVDRLIGTGFKLTLRPHPQTIRLAWEVVNRIAMEHGDNPDFLLEWNVSGWDSLYQSDVIISDWSGAALEYAFGLNKPVVYVDTPKKINNPVYAELPLVPIEEAIREKIGYIVAPDSIDQLKDIIHTALAKPKLNAVSVQDHVFNRQSDEEARKPCMRF